MNHSYDEKEIISILMKRDGMTKEEAIELLAECKEMVQSGIDPEEILLNEIGLEPDYIFGILA